MELDDLLSIGGVGDVGLVAPSSESVDFPSPPMPVPRKPRHQETGSRKGKRPYVRTHRKKSEIEQAKDILPVAGINFRSNSVKAWDIQAGEMPAQYAAFCAFRDLPRETRTVTEAALQYMLRINSPVRYKIIDGKVSNEIWVPSRIWIWCKTRQWRKRVELYDYYVEEEAAKLAARRRAEEISAMNERHAKQGRRLSEVAYQRIERMTDQEIALLDAKLVPQMLNSGVKIERVAMGEAGEVVDQKVESRTVEIEQTIQGLDGAKIGELTKLLEGIFGASGDDED